MLNPLVLTLQQPEQSSSGCSWKAALSHVQGVAPVPCPLPLAQAHRLCPACLTGRSSVHEILAGLFLSLASSKYQTQLGAELIPLCQVSALKSLLKEIKRCCFLIPSVRLLQCLHTPVFPSTGNPKPFVHPALQVSPCALSSCSCRV